MTAGRVFGPGERDERPSAVCGPCKLFQHDLCEGHPPCDCPAWDHLGIPRGPAELVELPDAEQ